MEKEEGDSVDRASHPCNSHVADIPVQEKGTTSEALEDNYGPWLLVSCKRNGTKGCGASMSDNGWVFAQEQREWDVHDPAAKAGTSSVPKTGSRYSMREGKRKLSPPKFPMAHPFKERNQGGVGEAPYSVQGPSPSSPIEKFHPGVEKDPVKPNSTSSASVKGKKDIARSKEHQKSFRGLERTNAISFVQSNNYPSPSFHSKPANGGGPDIGY